MMDAPVEEPDGWSEYGLEAMSILFIHIGNDGKNVPHHYLVFNAMIVCAICEFTNNICRYDPAVSDHHDFSGFEEAKVDDADLTWEKSSAPHIKPYIHQAYSGNGHYQCSVCKSCANELQTRKENIVHYRQSYVFAILNKCFIAIHACIIHCEYSSESYDAHIWMMILSWHGVSTWH